VSQVEVWTATLAAEPAELEALGALLSPDERERAARFAFAELRARFVVGRATLRRLLGAELQRPPGSLRFEYGPEGKPALLDAGDLRFNLAHSGELALYAIARGRAVGVDVERVRELRDADAVARRFFAPAEAEALRELPAERRPLAFFTCWTRKEAYVKARGGGLGLGLDSFQVGVEPRERACCVSVPGAGPFAVRDLAAPSGYRAAVAIEGEAVTVRERALA
jgi:4'-phosphopantetheinyl transferase